MFRQPVLSVVTKSTAFYTFSQSVVLYTTSYFGAASADLKLLRAAAVDLLLGRCWIRQDLLAYVLRWLKIAPLLDPGLSILVSALGLFLRKGGNITDLYQESPEVTNRQTHEVRELWEAWAQIVGEERLTRAVHVSGGIKRRTTAVKICILEYMTREASDYIRDKIYSSGWTGGIGWNWIVAAGGSSKRWIHGVARFTLLRWAVNEDDDEWLARRGYSRLRECIYCTLQ